MQEQENSLETAQTTDEQVNPLRELAKQLQANEDTAKTDESQELGDDKKPAAKSKPTTLKALAETLGLEDKDLYELQIPSSIKDAEPYTLGKLKDLAAQQDDFTVRTLKFEEDARRKETEIQRASQDLAELISAIPQDMLKPEIMQKVQQRRESAVAQERERTLEAIPQWMDSQGKPQIDVIEKDLQGMAEHLKSYGFDDRYLAQVYDHRTMKYIRDNWLREQRLRKALESVTEQKPNPRGRSKPNQSTKQRRTGAALTHHEQQVQNFIKTIQGN